MYDPIQLKDGLILRAATAEDIEAIAKMNAQLHCPDDLDGEGEMVAQWTRDIANPNHPTAGDPALVTIVVDPAKDNQIVSTMCIIPQIWRYDGVPFKFVRPEIVGTLDEYRNRSLVRAQFDWHHQWCEDNGYLVQGITGIPYFYRLFGYEYALNLDGSVSAFETDLPLKAKDPEPCDFREATLEDIPFLVACDQHFNARNLIGVPRDAERWQYELEGMHANNIYHREIVMIIVEDEPVGFYVHPGMLWGTNLTICRLELMPGTHHAKLLPAILRDAWKRGEGFAAKKENETIKGLRLTLGENHPAHSILKRWFKGSYENYAWYLRVSDLPKFLKIIAPALEARLVNSTFHGHTGNLKLDFYKNGVKITFDSGKIIATEPWRPSNDDEGNAKIPELRFLQLLFGFRTMEEIHHILPDTYARDGDSGELLKVLFPKMNNEELWSLA